VSAYPSPPWSGALARGRGLGVVADDPEPHPDDPGPPDPSGPERDDGGEVIQLARPLPNLHPEFWEQRRSLLHVRDAAHAACASPDLVLHAVLARLASMQHHETRVDTGLGEAVLNYSAVVVGPSGASKSTGVAVARDLLPAPERLNSDAYRDGIPLGSGEGLAELFMGHGRGGHRRPDQERVTAGRVPDEARAQAVSEQRLRLRRRGGIPAQDHRAVGVHDRPCAAFST
jgi:hypothetical protein